MNIPSCTLNSFISVPFVRSLFGLLDAGAFMCDCVCLEFPSFLFFSSPIHFFFLLFLVLSDMQKLSIPICNACLFYKYYNHIYIYIL